MDAIWKLAASVLVAGCGGTSDLPEPILGPVTELRLLEGYNHNSETTVAATGNDVVIVSINQILQSADSFQPGPSPGYRRVAAYVSDDGGTTFSDPRALDDMIADTTDPVVRVGADGTFWVAALAAEAGQSFRASLWASATSGAQWSLLAEGLEIDDKEWIAVDDLRQLVYVAGVGGMYALGFDGAARGHVTTDISARNATDAYADAEGVHVLASSREVLRWDGAGEIDVEVRPVFAGDKATVWTTIGALGPREGGGQWIVRTQRFADHAPLILGVRGPADDEWTERQLSAPGDVTFLPAAALDAENRLHIVYYDTTGESGVVRYTRSLTSDLSGPFAPPIDIDPDACPGDRWYPYGNDPLRTPGGRRLREYIGITVSGNRVHISWAHAPEAPSRVLATYVEYE